VPSTQIFNLRTRLHRIGDCVGGWPSLSYLHDRYSPRSSFRDSVVMACDFFLSCSFSLCDGPSNTDEIGREKNSSIRNGPLICHILPFTLGSCVFENLLIHFIDYVCLFFRQSRGNGITQALKKRIQQQINIFCGLRYDMSLKQKYFSIPNGRG